MKYEDRSLFFFQRFLPLFGFFWGRFSGVAFTGCSFSNDFHVVLFSGSGVQYSSLGLERVHCMWVWIYCIKSDALLC
jgi:hypothetical protein